MTTTTLPDPTPVRIWLAICAAMIFAMVVIGGVTRLTESGLSITEWRPITGTIPPLTVEDWQAEFAKYQRIPEFREKNATMTLDEFKTIFWWEYVHRLWGRLIGLAFALPLAWFAFTGRVRGSLLARLCGLLALGGLQGAVGWWMVASGLVDNPHVSHWRLAAHLGLAVLVYGLILALVERLQPSSRLATPAWLKRLSFILVWAIFMVILSGALVAGLDAGLVYNTFPTMGDQWIPDEVYLAENTAHFFSTPAAVQFLHRWFAKTIAVAILVFWALARRVPLAPAQRMPVDLLAGMAMVQIGLGILTIILQVPIGLAAAHQAGALVLYGLAVWTAGRLRQA